MAPCAGCVGDGRISALYYDLIAAADVEGLLHRLDQTVAKTTNGGTRSPAGIIVDVDESQVAAVPPSPPVARF